ncbi:MAG TPA: hypothetical protein DEO65_01850 [Bacillus bacterium]|nr:hypothetical protein [Bacillus sp. (in: firmicutes)]
MSTFNLKTAKKKDKVLRGIHMGEYKRVNKYLNDLDHEWVMLMREAKQLKVKKEDIRSYFKKMRNEQAHQGSDNDLIDPIKK